MARFITLRLRSKPDYDPDRLIHMGLDENEYVTVLSMPILEMISTEYKGMAAELVDYIADKKGVRPVAPGDMFYWGTGSVWMYVRESEASKFEGACMAQVEAAKASEPMLIVRMTEPSNVT